MTTAIVVQVAGPNLDPHALNRPVAGPGINQPAGGGVAAPVFSAQSAPGGTVGTPYSYTFVAT